MWIKVGGHLINEDMIAAVVIVQAKPGNVVLESIRVFMLGGHVMLFEGDEAKAVLDYLGDYAQDISANSGDARDYLAFRHSGGTLSAAAWFEARQRRHAILEEFGSHPAGRYQLELRELEKALKL